jgi:hypothetical protein
MQENEAAAAECILAVCHCGEYDQSTPAASNNLVLVLWLPVAQTQNLRDILMSRRFVAKFQYLSSRELALREETSSRLEWSDDRIFFSLKAPSAFVVQNVHSELHSCIF